MAKTAGVLTQGQVTAFLKSAKIAGYASATVKATLSPDGSKTVEVIAHIDDPAVTTQPNGNDDSMSAEDALAGWQRTRNEGRA
jgi:hypothetical protein